MGTNEENNIENFVCFIYGEAGAGPLHRLQLRNTKQSNRLCNNAPKWLFFTNVLVSYVTTYVLYWNLSSMHDLYRQNFKKFKILRMSFHALKVGDNLSWNF